MRARSRNSTRPPSVPKRLSAEAGDSGCAPTCALLLCSRISEHHEKHIECAPAYLEYGRALLRKAQQADDPFGSKLPREEAPKHAEPAGEAETSEAGEKPDACAGAEQNDGSDDGAEGEEGEEEAGEEAEADDLELAFQCLEMARLIYEAVRPSSRLPPSTDSGLTLTLILTLTLTLTPIPNPSTSRWHGSSMKSVRCTLAVP